MQARPYAGDGDDLPSKYRDLASHFQTPDTDMDLSNRLNDYLAVKVAMATTARRREIDQMLNEQCSGATQVSNHFAGSAYWLPLRSKDFQSKYRNQDDTNSPSRDDDELTPCNACDNLSKQEEDKPQNWALLQASPNADDVTTPSLPCVAESVKESPPLYVCASAIRTITQPQYNLHANETLEVDNAAANSCNMQDHALSRKCSFTAELAADVKRIADVDREDPVADCLLGSDQTRSYQSTSQMPPGQSS